MRGHASRAALGGAVRRHRHLRRGVPAVLGGRGRADRRPAAPSRWRCWRWSPCCPSTRSTSTSPGRPAKDPPYTAYATANMTGANRLLIGVGWASIVAAVLAQDARARDRHRPRAVHRAVLSSCSRRRTRSSSRSRATLVALGRRRAARRSSSPTRSRRRARTSWSPSSRVRRNRSPSFGTAGRRLRRARALRRSPARRSCIAAEPFAEGLLETGGAVRHRGVPARAVARAARVGGARVHRRDAVRAARQAGAGDGRR